VIGPRAPQRSLDRIDPSLEIVDQLYSDCLQGAAGGNPPRSPPNLPVRAWRREVVGSRPRRIGVTRGLARTREVMLAGAPPRRARAACDSCV
jgi:hypothetical protein